jgi:shikimate dehydrogenase
MLKFISLSQHPGKQGQYYYTEFFKLYKLDAEYTPLAASDSNLFSIINDAKESNVSGISISMPFKQKVIKCLDYIDNTAKDYNSCNSILIKDKKLHGYNADIAGVQYASQFIDIRDTISILGKGCMGKMFYTYLIQNKYPNVLSYSRSTLDWSERHIDAEIVINCTALGTVSSDSPLDYISDRTKTVIDLSINPGKLAEQCKEKNVLYVSGQEFYKNQFIKQFYFYTNINIGSLEYDVIKNNILF